mmetsp:Transcript_3346/g.12108  ORF Transcript_3346/g.12108 Transcript_3346/m.12108 type:complete len:221 (+) Transcript_3346:963-1625(+)
MRAWMHHAGVHSFLLPGPSLFRILRQLLVWLSSCRPVLRMHLRVVVPRIEVKIRHIPYSWLLAGRLGLAVGDSSTHVRIHVSHGLGPLLRQSFRRRRCPHTSGRLTVGKLSGHGSLLCANPGLLKRAVHPLPLSIQCLASIGVVVNYLRRVWRGHRRQRRLVHESTRWLGLLLLLWTMRRRRLPHLRLLCHGMAWVRWTMRNTRRRHVPVVRHGRHHLAP